jgi:phosphomannomutase
MRWRSSVLLAQVEAESVQRDVFVEIVGALGSTAVPLRRASRFIPADTEALREEDAILERRWTPERALDAHIFPFTILPDVWRVDIQVI